LKERREVKRRLKNQILVKSQKKLKEGREVKKRKGWKNNNFRGLSCRSMFRNQSKSHLRSG
jgi:hypothetical protein